MTDWKQIARALSINATDEELENALAPLSGLEEQFSRISARLAPDAEAAVTITALLEDSAE